MVLQLKPDADDYLGLFARYKADFGDVYMDPEDERFRFLFDQMCRLLIQPSEFNLNTLPEQFRITADRYLTGDEKTVAHMRVVENRHFMLSDLFDYVHLVHTMGGIDPVRDIEVITMGGKWDQRGR